jgi:hypothetical protein
MMLPLIGRGLAAQQLTFGRAPVTLQGHLTVKTFPGRPNYESIKKGDEREVQWILKLHHPITAQPAPGDEYNYGVVNAELVTLASLRSELWPLLKGLEDKDIVVTGQLASASSPHHHTDLVLTVERVAREQIRGQQIREGVREHENSSFPSSPGDANSAFRKQFGLLISRHHWISARQVWTALLLR